MFVRYSHAVVIAGALALAACSDDADETAASGDPVDTAPTSEATGPAPEPVSAEPEVPEVAPCPDKPGLACSGPLIVEVENLALAPQQHDIYVSRLTVVIKNRSEDPVRVMMPASDIVINFDNGASLSGYSRNSGVVSGLQICQQAVTECFQRQPSDFKILQPGDSPARINIEVRERVDTSLLPSLPSIATGTVTFDLFAVDINGNGTREQVALPKAPVVNQTGN